MNGIDYAIATILLVLFLTILVGLSHFYSQGEEMSAALDALTAQVTKLETSVQAAVTAIQNLAAQPKEDPTKLAALTQGLQTAQTQLDAAVAAVTTPPAA